MVKEVATLHLGQAGVQMGSALWELYCVEHGITAEGRLSATSEGSPRPSTDRVETLFCESRGQYVPRTVLIDLEPTVIDEIKSGSYKHLFSPSCLISGNEDAANNYSRGFYTIGKDKIDMIMDAIRRVVNNCDSISAFQIMHSYSGGTGSGLTSLLLTKLAEAYGKKFRVSVGIFPSSTMSQSTVDPYNSLLHTHSTIELIDCGIIFDNESLYRKAINHLSCARPTYSLMNRLISQMITCVFLSHRYRYEGTHHIDVDELLTNLVPYPRIHFPVLSYAPIVGPDQIKHEKIDVYELTRNVFQGDAHFVDCSFENNKYLSCCLLYRGYVSPRAVYDAVGKVKCDRKISFVDWCPTGFKLGLNTMPPIGVPNLPLATPSSCLCMVSGNVGIREAWKRDRSKFDLIFNKRAFVHWFVGEGLEEGEFMEAREDIITLENDYEEIAKDTDDLGNSTDRKPSAVNAISKRPSDPKNQVKIETDSKRLSQPLSVKSGSIKKENSPIQYMAKRITSPSIVLDRSPVDLKTPVENESSNPSELIDMSNNAFISNSNMSHQNSYKYLDDLDYGLEIEDPSWIEGSPSYEPRERNIGIISTNNLNLLSNVENRNQTNIKQVERNTSYRILAPVRIESIKCHPSKSAKLMPTKPSNNNSNDISKPSFSNQQPQQMSATRNSRNIKRAWWRRASSSINNSGIVKENCNQQIDNMCSKMEYEIFDKNTSNNSNIISWKDSNPFCKVNQMPFENVMKFVSSSPENPFKCVLNIPQSEVFSSRISSFVGNGTPSNNSSNLFQCSPFLPTISSNEVIQSNNLSLNPKYKSLNNDSNSNLSLILPPPPDAEDLKRNLVTKCDLIPSNELSKNLYTTKPNNRNCIPLNGPTFSSFTPSIPHFRIPVKTKIPSKSHATPMHLTQSCIFDSTTHNIQKKRNLIISPMESLDCEASKSKQPKLSLMSFLYKKFHSSK